MIKTDENVLYKLMLKHCQTFDRSNKSCLKITQKLINNNHIKTNIKKCYNNDCHHLRFIYGLSTGSVFVMQTDL